MKMNSMIRKISDLNYQSSVKASFKDKKENNSKKIIDFEVRRVR